MKIFSSLPSFFTQPTPKEEVTFLEEDPQHVPEEKISTLPSPFALYQPKKKSIKVPLLENIFLTLSPLASQEEIKEMAAEAQLLLEAFGRYFQENAEELKREAGKITDSFFSRFSALLFLIEKREDLVLESHESGFKVISSLLNGAREISLEERKKLLENGKWQKWIEWAKDSILPFTALANAGALPPGIDILVGALALFILVDRSLGSRFSSSLMEFALPTQKESLFSWWNKSQWILDFALLVGFFRIPNPINFALGVHETLTSFLGIYFKHRQDVLEAAEILSRKLEEVIEGNQGDLLISLKEQIEKDANVKESLLLILKRYEEVKKQILEEGRG